MEIILIIKVTEYQYDEDEYGNPVRSRKDYIMERKYTISENHILQEEIADITTDICESNDMYNESTILCIIDPETREILPWGYNHIEHLEQLSAAYYSLKQRLDEEQKNRYTVRQEH